MHTLNQRVSAQARPSCTWREQDEQRLSPVPSPRPQVASLTCLPRSGPRVLIKCVKKKHHHQTKSLPFSYTGRASRSIQHPEGAGPRRGAVSPGAFSLVIVSWHRSQVGKKKREQLDVSPSPLPEVLQLWLPQSDSNCLNKIKQAWNLRGRRKKFEKQIAREFFSPKTRNKSKP